ncbi:TerD family protein [Okeania sp.]|uniref:TerD family protein n=1 Tax=Okeania sp. TaxID=3100323 RepID=UPI002B4B409F|nr:TerD family protein [Okeania sp.]MEB3343110.1 TerD family protein [Okeania sp.]
MSTEKYFVFYNNLTSPDSSIKHSGDSRTGEGSGDDKLIEIDLKKVDQTIQ